MSQPWPSAPQQPAGQMPWAPPPPSGGMFRASDYLGCLIIVCVGGYHPIVGTRYGDRPAVRAGVVVLTGPNAGEQIPDALIFSTNIVNRLRSAAGTVILGRIAEVPTPNGRSYDLAETTAEDQQTALAWHTSNAGVLDKLLADAATAHQQETERAARPSAPQQPTGQQPPQQYQQGAYGPPGGNDRPSYYGNPAGQPWRNNQPPGGYSAPPAGNSGPAAYPPVVPASPQSDYPPF